MHIFGRLNHKDAICLVGLTLLVLLAYGRVAHFGPINLDDPVAIETNPIVNQLPPGLSQFTVALWYVGPLNLWHPVTWWSHQVDTLVFGFPAWGARHLVNAALHAAVVALLYLLLFRLTGSRAGAFVGALLFAIHPQRVEVVAWLTARKELLAGLCILLTCLSWMAWRRRGGFWRWGACFFAFLGALASHPVTLMFAPVLLLLDRCIPAGESAKPQGWGLRLLSILPFFIAAGLVALGTLWVHKAGGLSGLETSHGTGDRIGRILLGAWYYAWSFFIPIQQRLFEIPPAGPGTIRKMALLGFIVLLGCALGLRRLIANNQRIALLGAGWALFFLLPVSGIVAMSPYLGSDRYTYLPHMGISILIAWLWPRGSRWQKQMGVAAAILAMVWLTATERRLSDWKSSESLFRAEVKASPRSKIAALHLGAALLDTGNPGEALVWFERSLAIDPNFDLAQRSAEKARFRLELGERPR